MDKKDNDYCAGIDACSIWHYVGLVCGIWRGDPRNRMARHVKNISYKYWYGFLAFNNQNDKYELVQYKYDGEMITETVLVSASSEADYKSQADQYLADARELKAYALDDRTPFGDEAAE